jgi:hypothetical protein
MTEKKSDGFEYRSRISIFGIPLVHICSKTDPETGRVKPAKGIIAVGPRAIGLVAAGAVTNGVFSAGAVAMGMFAAGAIAIGGVATGAIAAGGVTRGAVLMGVIDAGGAVTPRMLGKVKKR